MEMLCGSKEKKIMGERDVLCRQFGSVSTENN